MFRWASGLSLATEDKMQFHKLTSGEKKKGSATIHVVCGLAQPSYFMGHILGEPLEHADVSTYLGSPSLVVLCQRHGGWGATGAMLLADGKRPLRYTNYLSEQHST